MARERFNKVSKDANKPIRVNPTAGNMDALGTFTRERGKNKITARLIGRDNGATLFELSKALSETGAHVNPQVARVWVTYDVCQLKGYGAVSYPARGKHPDTGKQADTQRVFLLLPGETWQAHKATRADASAALPEPDAQAESEHKARVTGSM